MATEDGAVPRSTGLLKLFVYPSPAMAFGIQERKVFIVECKRCKRNVPAGVLEYPFQSIVVTCPLCGEQRRYLPSEVSLGRPHHVIAKQAQTDVR